MLSNELLKKYDELLAESPIEEEKTVVEEQQVLTTYSVPTEVLRDLKSMVNATYSKMNSDLSQYRNSYFKSIEGKSQLEQKKILLDEIKNKLAAHEINSDVASRMVEDIDSIFGTKSDDKEKSHGL